jgi:glycosyltransferase involved in cell wall biosynthesis
LNLVPEPLVSVIIRSMDRPELAEALASVAQTTYPAVEVLVVNAKGGEHSPLAKRCGNFPLRLANAGGPPLPRASAGNLGLYASSGEYALFLDDDDLLDAPHLGKLAAALQSHTESPAAYTGVRLVDGDNQLIRDMNIGWEHARLQGMNFLPIHAVLFRRTEALAHCHFDEQLAVLEDWDFWLQLASRGDFINLPGTSAVYRISLGNSGLSSKRDLNRFRQAHAQILTKWNATGTSAMASNSLIWFSTAVDQLSTTVSQQSSYIERQTSSIEQLAAENASLRDQLSRLSWERDALRQAQSDLLNSTSWKITAPLRNISRRLRPETKKHD